MRTLCVILARAGSRGLPRKNELTVAGQPMLAWTLDHALGSRTVDRVVLSTDGERLADLARARGVKVVLRPSELAHDTATVDSAARHALDAIEADAAEKNARRLFEHVVILYGNVPVRPADLTDRAMRKLIDTGCDSVQSVYRVGKTHPLWMRTVDAVDGDRLGHYQPNEIYRRQDLPPVYMLNGGVIAVRRASLLDVQPDRPHAFLGRDQRAIVTGEGDVIDVDSEVDLRVAEAVLQMRGEPRLTVRAAG